MPAPPRPNQKGPTSAGAAQLNQAVALHQAGRLDEAEALYRQVVAQAPGHFDATHLLGVIALQRGDLAAAETLISQALASRPKDATALNNLGTTLLRARRLDEAREQFERAAKAQPAHVDAQSNLGNVLRQLGRIAESVVPLKRAFAGSPKSAEIADLLGASLLDTGDGRGAVAVFESSVKARPREARGWLHLAIASQMAGNPKRALEAADAALAITPGDSRALGARGQALAGLGDAGLARDAFAHAVLGAPDDAVARHNFGVFLRDLGDHDAAIEQLRKAVQLDPALAAAHEALVGALVDGGRGDEAMRHGQAFASAHPDSGAALAMQAAAHFAQGRIEEAVDLYRRAAAIADADAATFLGYGNALLGAGHAAEATKQFARAVERDPQDSRARFALAMSHLRPVYDDAAQMEASRRAFSRALSELDAWFTPARAVSGARGVGSAQPFYLAYHPVDVRPLLMPYGKTVARLMASVAAPPLDPRPTAARKLRVGIAAAQVRDHSVWNAITQGWVRHFDRERIELTLFKLEPASDDETARARRDATAFVDKPVTLDDWAQAIVDARLDVLIYPEIGMHPLTTRLAAMRLAPVQAAAWGQPLTTGLPTIDLFISAQALEPANGASHYSERLVALPHLGVCLQPLQPAVVAPDFATLGLNPAEPLLLCPGTPFKYTPQGDAALVAIAARLQARGAGRLVFFGSHRPAMSAQVEQRMRKAFANAGVDYDRTVAWIPTLNRGRFFGLMQRSTALLDTLGFSGFNTAVQGLECDLPVVAFEDKFMRGRLASGPLRFLGLDELVATTPAEFADIALRLVEDEAWRAHVEREIAQRRHALFFDQAPVRALEDALFEAAGVAKPA
ncbi:tetratricopeptide repeat protein [Scleromatobacter humisilvae]|uniref:protein O-GlcNAc transferase n=1 Tax=Scleromatobacter humisilvae TaxID=2897159 RepID=A0A9X2BYK9_9BURK|nr:tetratricopeptide repeat protein [Scleromatobacter humisilvae]MCK9685502.1 tetratricopeptide repeat protein [Scleromatobacter humisilvae]